MKFIIISSLAMVCLANPLWEKGFHERTHRQWQWQRDVLFSTRGPSHASSPPPSIQEGAPQPSSTYGTPSQGQFGAPSTQYGSPGQGSQAPSSQYGAPSQFGGSSQFGALPTQYGTPSTNAPSQQNGAPGFGGSQGDFGGNAFKGQEQSHQYLPPGAGVNARDDGSNKKPASYSFEYMVKNEKSGNYFGRRESRQGDKAEGLYYVLLPDGRKQTVEYEVDQNGYKPKISYEHFDLDQYDYGDRPPRPY